MKNQPTLFPIPRAEFCGGCGHAHSHHAAGRCDAHDVRGVICPCPAFVPRELRTSYRTAKRREIRGKAIVIAIQARALANAYEPDSGHARDLRALADAIEATSLGSIT